MSSDASATIRPTFTSGEGDYLGIKSGFPGAKLVHERPPVYTVDNFLTSEECDRLISQATPQLAPSIVVDGAGGRIPDPSRTSSSCFLERASTTWLAEKITALTGKPEHEQESAQVAHYTEGQFYRAHYDAFDLNNKPGRDCFATGGQRVGTVLIYLNDVREGGATSFSELGLSVAPKRGMALVFFPCNLAGDLDRLALHAAEPCKDDKWVSQVWIRASAFR